MSRLDLILLLIKQKNYRNYLEIGCNKDTVFNKIPIYKVGVDPERGGNLRMTSDDFFQYNTVKFDIIFIDGLHHADQAYRDINNAINILEDFGTIVVHDCNPIDYKSQLVPRITKKWNGDVWKAWVRIRSERDDVNMYVVDIDEGCGIIQFGSQIKIRPTTEYYEMIKDKQYYLNLISYDKILSVI